MTTDKGKGSSGGRVGMEGSGDSVTEASKQSIDKFNTLNLRVPRPIKKCRSTSNLAGLMDQKHVFPSGVMSSLTAAQKDLLRQSWQRTNKANGPAGIGGMIFKRIFDQCPQIKQLFGFEAIPTAQLAYNKQFRKHAAVFVKVLNEVVTHLDSLEKDMTPKLMEYGRHHVQFQGAGFGPQYWDVFAEAMTSINWTSPGRSRREISKAWTVLVSFVIDKMRHGYDTEKRRIRNETLKSQHSQSSRDSN